MKLYLRHAFHVCNSNFDGPKVLTNTFENVNVIAFSIFFKYCNRLENFLFPQSIILEMKTFQSSDTIFQPESIKLNRPRSHRNQLIF